MASAPLAMFLAGAAPRGVDLLGLALLLAFTWWGARKGAVRQALSLLVLGASFAAAGRLAPSVEPTLAKLFALPDSERLAAAWAAVLFGALVLGALLLRLLAPGLPVCSRRGAERVLGGLLGAAKGAVILTLAGYLALGVAGASAGPALSRPTVAPGDAASLPAVRERVRGSLSAVCLEEWSGLLRRVVPVPPWVSERIEIVNRDLRDPTPGRAPAARPRGP